MPKYGKNFLIMCNVTDLYIKIDVLLLTNNKLEQPLFMYLNLHWVMGVVSVMSL